MPESFHRTYGDLDQKPQLPSRCPTGGNLFWGAVVQAMLSDSAAGLASPPAVFDDPMAPLAGQPTAQSSYCLRAEGWQVDADAGPMVDGRRSSSDTALDGGLAGSLDQPPRGAVLCSAPRRRTRHDRW